jgi:hypothetical protein
MKRTRFMLQIGAILLLVSMLVFNSCEKEDDDDDDGAGPGFTNADYLNRADCTGIDVANNTYTKSIKAIFDANCATSGCHGAKNSAHGLNLSTYSSSKSQFNEHSLLCAINWESNCSRMPTNGTKLSASDINKITCWAKNGFAE